MSTDPRLDAPKQKALRWSLNQAAQEFGLSRQTVKNRMVRAAIDPAPDQTYTTSQLVAGLFGDTAGEKLRKLAAEREIAELEAGRMRGDLVPAREVSQQLAHAVSECRTSWLQLPAKAAVAFPTWPDARACEAWMLKQAREILTELATEPRYRQPEAQQNENEPDASA